MRGDGGPNLSPAARALSAAPRPGRSKTSSRLLFSLVRGIRPRAPLGWGARRGAPMSRHDVQQRRAAGAARDGDAEAPVRVRTTTEQSRVRYALWARGAALVVVVLASVGGLLYASSKLRFVEDVLPRISGA